MVKGGYGVGQVALCNIQLLDVLGHLVNVHFGRLRFPSNQPNALLKLRHSDVGL